MKTKNVCPHCDGPEFISQLNQYDVYEYNEEDGRVHFARSELIDDEVELSCRDCSEIMSFDGDDIVM
jgi:hypothetical protein